MFVLEKEIRKWKKNLRKNSALEDGDIAELESHLRDEISQLKEQEIDEKKAFITATENLGHPGQLDAEMGKIRNKKIMPSNNNSFSIGLALNYLNSSIRALKKNKGFSVINILGLAVGIWACLAIYLVIQDDLSYDEFHTKADQIYRIENQITSSQTGEIAYRSRTPMPWARSLKEEIPEVKETGRFMKSGDGLLFTIDNVSYNENSFLYADNSMLNIFSFEFISGDNEDPLTRPNTAILTEEYAAKFFGNENPLGKTIISEVGWYGPVEYEVTAVIKNLPKNSHFQQNIFLSFPTLEYQLFTDINENWGIHFYYTYLLLEPETNEAQLDNKLGQFVNRHYDEEQAERYNPELVPLTDIYLYSPGSGQLGSTGSIEYIYTEAIIAFLILLIAIFNFVNLSTAQSFERAKEVGVRKVLGADRFSLIRQYISESVTYCFIAVIIALLLLSVTIPLINSVSGKLLSLGIIGIFELIPQLVFAALVTGILAGLYPSLFLSSFQPHVIFKGLSGSGDKTRFIRKLLVGFQFAISAFLIISTITVYNQLNYLKERELGFDKNQLLEIELLSRDVIESSSLLKSRLNQLGSVTQVTSTTGGMGGELYGNSYTFENTPKGSNEQTMGRYAVDHDFFSTLGIPIIAGREPDASFSSDSSGYVILNRAAVLEAGWQDPEDAIGSRVTYTRPNGDAISSTILAVSENFHVESPHQEVEAMVMEYWNEAIAALIVQISNIDEENVSQIQQAYNEILPSMPFEFTFMDDRINSLYVQEDQLGNFFYWFAILAILIACMGLFGVAAYAISRRTKEIGVRKILGADSVQIVGLLSKDFIKLVIIAFLIAVPLAWYAMNSWLSNFAFRVEIGIGVFFISGLTILGIAFLTVSWQSIRAALMNPVKSLRSE